MIKTTQFYECLVHCLNMWSKTINPLPRTPSLPKKKIKGSIEK